LNGKLRCKRGDTLVRTIEQRYGVGLGVRGDMRLDTLRDRLGADSIEAALRDGRRD
jgi:hypothetical protein